MFLIHSSPDGEIGYTFTYKRPSSRMAAAAETKKGSRLVYDVRSTCNNSTLPICGLSRRIERRGRNVVTGGRANMWHDPRLRLAEWLASSERRRVCSQQDPRRLMQPLPVCHWCIAFSTTQCARGQCLTLLLPVENKAWLGRHPEWVNSRRLHVKFSVKVVCHPLPAQAVCGLCERYDMSRGGIHGE